MIRKLVQNDWEEYKALRLLSLTTDPDVYFSTFDEVSRWNDGNFKSEIYSNPDSVFGYYGCFVDDQLVGYISLSGQYFTKQKHTADVFNLYIHPDFRGQGFAKELIQTLITNAKKMGSVEKLFLSVMSQNEAGISLYTSFGFQTYGIKRHSLKSKERYFDETVMDLDLLQSPQVL